MVGATVAFLGKGAHGEHRNVEQQHKNGAVQRVVAKIRQASIGIVVGSATIMLVLAIGTGGKEEVAEQFKNLNAEAIDISCDTSDSGGFSFEMPGGGGNVTVTNMGGGPGGGSGGGTQTHPP